MPETATQVNRPGKSDEKLLKELRDRLDYCVQAWKSIREEAAIDTRYASGDPWEPAEKAEREANGRPAVVFDELNQHINQLVNDVRVNKRAVRVIPKGDGATDELARVRAEKIRAIEYKSNAQSAYATAFEHACSRSYGWIRLSTRYLAEDSFEQEPCIKRVPNPDNVLMDPDFKEADASDMKYLFYFDFIPKEEFKRRWPNAECKDFTAEQEVAYPAWVRDKDVRVAEYWKIKTRNRTLVLLGPKEAPTKMWADEIPESLKEQQLTMALRKREVEVHTVCQYITNGVEILEETDWAGRWIPFVPVFGKEIYVGDKRVILSLVRLARDPYMYYCWVRSNEMEVMGISPKVPWVGYEGQFDTSTDWSTIHKVPRGYAEVKATTEATGAQVLPIPQRQVFEPPVQAMELAADSAKRSIMSAMGRYNASVGKSDSAARSGVAIKELQTAADQGSFHFIDNYDRAIEHVGRQLNNLITVVMDTEREEELRKADDTYERVTLNKRYVDKGKEQYYPMNVGEFDVTISTGPSFDSQREEAEQFANTLAGIPEIFGRVADLVVKLKNLGPIGDQIAERLAPPDSKEQGQIPPQALAAIQKQKQELAALNAYGQKLEAEIKALKDESNAKMIEMQSQERRTAMQERTKILVKMADLQKAGAETLLKAELAQIDARLQREQMQLEREEAAATAAGSNGESATMGA